MNTMTIKALAAAALLLAGCAGPTGPASSTAGTAGEGGEGGSWHWTGGSGGGGSGGEGGSVLTTSSTSSSTTASTGPTLGELKALCTTTGGTVNQSQCCSDLGQMPTTCMGGPSCGQVITCMTTVDPSLWLCVCPEDQCFDREAGCSSPS